MKKPHDEDDTVYDVINFLETRKRSGANLDARRRPTRCIKMESRDSDQALDSDDAVAGKRREEEDSVRALNLNQHKISSSSKRPTSRVAYPGKTKDLDKPPSLQSPSANNIITPDTLPPWFKQMELLLDEKLSATPQTNIQRPYSRHSHRACFNCGKTGHYIEECCQKPQQQVTELIHPTILILMLPVTILQPSHQVTELTHPTILILMQNTYPAYSSVGTIRSV